MKQLASCGSLPKHAHEEVPSSMSHSAALGMRKAVGQDVERLLCGGVHSVPGGPC